MNKNMTNVEKMAKILKDEDVTHFNMFLPSCPKDATEEYKTGEFIKMYENCKNEDTVDALGIMPFF